MASFEVDAKGLTQSDSELAATAANAADGFKPLS